MDSKQKVELLQTAIKQLIEDEKTGSSSVDSFVTVAKDGDEAGDDSRFLSKLLSQLEALEEDGVLEKQSTEEKVPSPEIVEKRKGTHEASRCSSEAGKDEIVKELRKVRRQNLVTHCLLSVMIVLTVAWQLSEVSLLLKVKEGLNHPFKSLGGLVKGILKPPGVNSQEVMEEASAKQNPIVRAAALPGLKIPEIPHVEFPAFDFDSDDE